MSYGGHGGLGYRNGELVENASDALITPDCVNHGVPGGFPPADLSVIANGDTGGAINGHVILGDGPVMVTLYKHTLAIYLLADGRFHEQNLMTIGVDLPDGVVIDFDDGTCMLSADRLVEDTDTLRFEIEGHAIEYRMIAHPRWVQHARITQPDGTVWTGFCGNEIGAGHDEEDTAPIARRHQTIFDGDDSDLFVVRQRQNRQMRRR